MLYAAPYPADIVTHVAHDRGLCCWLRPFTPLLLDGGDVLGFVLRRLAEVKLVVADVGLALELKCGMHMGRG